jgi:predicted MFS family arabinose efflux permease
MLGMAKNHTHIETGADLASSSTKGEWGAVFALTLCVSMLIASEFMPVSLLTPIATDLQVSEGQAGQAIAVSGIFAVITSLFIAPRRAAPTAVCCYCGSPD